MERSDRIPLPPQEPRCSAAVCVARTKCARARAAIPHHWAKVQDYSTAELGGEHAATALCSGFLSIAAVLAAPSVPAKRTHRPMEGNE